MKLIFINFIFLCLNYVRTDSNYITLFLLIFSVLPKIIANCKIDNPNCQSNKIYNKRFVRKIARFHLVKYYSYGILIIDSTKS